jgi:hypothetical protein
MRKKQQHTRFFREYLVIDCHAFRTTGPLSMSSIQFMNWAATIWNTTESFLSNGYGKGGGLYPGLKLLGREADDLLLSSVKIMNGWSCTSNPQYVFMACYLVKHGDSFTFTLQ